MGIGLGVGDDMRARAESDAGFGVELVIRVLEFIAPMIIQVSLPQTRPRGFARGHSRPGYQPAVNGLKIKSMATSQ